MFLKYFKFSSLILALSILGSDLNAMGTDQNSAYPLLNAGAFISSNPDKSNDSVNSNENQNQDTVFADYFYLYRRADVIKELRTAAFIRKVENEFTEKISNIEATVNLLKLKADGLLSEPLSDDLRATINGLYGEIIKYPRVLMPDSERLNDAIKGHSQVRPSNSDEEKRIPEVKSICDKTYDFAFSNPSNFIAPSLKKCSALLSKKFELKDESAQMAGRVVVGVVYVAIAAFIAKKIYNYLKRKNDKNKDSKENSKQEPKKENEQQDQNQEDKFEAEEIENEQLLDEVEDYQWSDDPFTNYEIYKLSQRAKK